MRTNRETALNNYKNAKVEYLNNPIKKNWIAFCDCKRECMRLGIRL